jgi:hypothetical protein
MHVLLHLAAALLIAAEHSGAVVWQHTRAWA